jgi:hypothetical protein
MASRFRRRNVVYVVMLAGLLAVVWASYRNFTDTKAPTEKPLSDLLTALDELPIEVIRPSTSNVWLTVVLPNAILFVVVAGFLWYVLRRYRGKQPPPAC